MRIKYLLSVVVGFLTILAIGIISVVMFRAKRSIAPEQQSVPVQDVQPLKPLLIPAEKATGVGALEDLPEFVRSTIRPADGGIKVYSVEFVNGQRGFRVEQDTSLALNVLAGRWREIFAIQKLQVKNVTRADGIFLEVTTEAVTIQVRLLRLTNSSTGLLIYVLPIK